MTRSGVRTGIISVCALAVCVFAAVRVWPYVRGNPDPEDTPERRALIRTLKNGVLPEYDESELAGDVESIMERIRQKTYIELTRLPPGHRPSDQDARNIASVFSEFVGLNRSGSLEDAIERYRSRSIEPNPVLVQEDMDRARLAWAYSTTWARHKDINVDSIRVVSVFQSGRAVSDPRMNGAPISARQLRSGGFASTEPHRFSAFEATINAVVPNRDAISEHAVDICVLIINDLPGGGWDVVQTTWDGLPSGKFFSLPFP